MKTSPLKNLPLAAALAAALFAAILCRRQSARVSELDSQLQHTRAELAAAHLPLKRDTIRDSVEVVTQTVAVVVPKQLKDALAADEQLIRELRLRITQLEALHTTAVELRDTVPARHDADLGVFFYSDQWADLKLSLKDTVFSYAVRDSITTLVYREYAHRFLWWRWGTKGYRLKIVNFNPHARVIYNRYVMPEK